jgi:hypothetical protein
MSPDLEKQLVKQYPEIFKDYGVDARVSNMFFGVECGDGWFGLIDCLCQKIQHRIGSVGTGGKGVWHRIKMCWNIMWHGKDYVDDIMLKREDAKRLAEVIIELTGDSR